LHTENFLNRIGFAFFSTVFALFAVHIFTAEVTEKFTQRFAEFINFN